MDWDSAIPWEDLKLRPEDAPGWLARGIVAAARWFAGYLAPLGLIVAIAVLALVAAALVAGLIDRDGALVRLRRVLFASAVVVMVVSGLVVTVANVLASAMERVLP